MLALLGVLLGVLALAAPATAQTDTTAPTFVSATVNGSTLEITFNEDLDTSSKPSGAYFYVNGSYSGDIHGTIPAVTIAGKVVTVTLIRAIWAGETVTVRYTANLDIAPNRVRDEAGNNASDFSGQSVTNNAVDTTKPALGSAAVNGTSLRLNYNEPLDTGSTPATTDFTVSVAGTNQTPTGVAVSGQSVTLTLGTAATAGQTVTVTYTKPGTNPIQDLTGNDADAISNRTVTNVTGDTTVPTVSSATVNGTTVTLNYSEALDTGSTPATTDFNVSVTGILPAFGRMPLDRIDPEDVAAWFDAASRDKPGAANRALEILRAMMFRAEEWGLRERGTNPCLGIAKNPAKKVARFLDAGELARLGRALDAHDARWPEAVAAIRLLTLTGCRRGEVLNLRWRNIGEDALNLEDSKTGPRAVPLGEAARALIDTQPGPRDPDAYLFPRHAEGRGIWILTNCWRTVCADARLGRLRLHDLRHTAASQAVMAGENLPLVGKLLGHRRNRTTAGYAHLDDAHLVKAAEKVGAIISRAMTVPDTKFRIKNAVCPKRSL